MSIKRKPRGVGQLMDRKLRDPDEAAPPTLDEWQRDLTIDPERYTPEFRAWLERRRAK